MKLLYSVAVLLSMICAFAVPARAQDAPPQETVENPTISMRLGAGATADGAAGAKNTGQTLNAGLDKQFVFKRGALSLSGDASQYFYASTGQDLSTLTYSGGATFSHQGSARANFTLGERVSQGYARQIAPDLAVAESARLLFPTALTRTYSTGGTFAYLISPRSQIQTGLQYNRIKFDLPTAPSSGAEQAILSNNSTVSYAVAFQRQITKSNAIGVTNDYSRNVDGINDATTYGVRGTWTRPIGPNMTLSAQGGFNMYQLAALDGARYAPTMGATLSRRLTRNTLNIRVERYVEVLGNNTHVSQVIDPTFSFPLTRRITLGLEGTLAFNTFPVEKKYNYQARIATANMRYALPRNLAITASYSHWDRILTNQDAATSTTYYALVAVSYGKAWR